MSWMTDDGAHEGWVARVLDDGREATGSTGRQREDGGLEMLEVVPAFDGQAQREERVSSDRVGSWVARCTCGWRGSLWERVTELHEASDATRRGWRPLGEVGDEPPHVEEALHAEWRRHLQPHDAAAEVRRAAAAVAEHQQHLETAVVAARRQGLSWEKIGAAAGVSRQAAHERWGRRAAQDHLDNPPESLFASPEQVAQRRAETLQRLGAHPVLVITPERDTPGYWVLRTPQGELLGEEVTRVLTDLRDRGVRLHRPDDSALEGELDWSYESVRPRP